MGTRFSRLTRSLVFSGVAAALAFGLVSAPAAVADDRLQFTGTTLSGAPFNGASLAGKPSVLWFWTPWCPFCNAEAPSVSQVAAANPNTIVYLETLGEVDVTSFQQSVPALLWSSYNGQRKGASLADVLLGRTNPSGRLPFSWYADVNQPAVSASC